MYADVIYQSNFSNFKEDSSLKVIFFAMSVCKNEPRLKWGPENKRKQWRPIKKQYLNMKINQSDWFSRTDKAKKMAFKVGPSLVTLVKAAFAQHVIVNDWVDERNGVGRL